LRAGWAHAIYGVAATAEVIHPSSTPGPRDRELALIKCLGLVLLVMVTLLVGCNPAPDDPTVAVRRYAPYDNFYGRRGGTPTE
jgi:hypothetical protein